MSTDNSLDFINFFLNKSWESFLSEDLLDRSFIPVPVNKSNSKLDNGSPINNIETFDFLSTQFSQKELHDSCLFWDVSNQTKSTNIMFISTQVNNIKFFIEDNMSLLELPPSKNNLCRVIQNNLSSNKHKQAICIFLVGYKNLLLDLFKIQNSAPIPAQPQSQSNQNQNILLNFFLNISAFLSKQDVLETVKKDYLDKKIKYSIDLEKTKDPSTWFLFKAIPAIVELDYSKYLNLLNFWDYKINIVNTYSFFNSKFFWNNFSHLTSVKKHFLVSGVNKILNINPLNDLDTFKTFTSVFENLKMDKNIDNLKLGIDFFENNFCLIDKPLNNSKSDQKSEDILTKSKITIKEYLLQEIKDPFLLNYLESLNNLIQKDFVNKNKIF